ncbi:MAG: DUF1298 domain-containing protein [Actinobacteria bacterium]|nr:DUF1298 domain-containing protein [Actinomycetota bacterium]
MPSLERLSAEDVRILHLESETIAGHTCKVVIFERIRGRDLCDLVRQRIAERLDRVPRARQCVVPTKGPDRGACWCDDPAFAIERHVRPAIATGGRMARDGLRALVAEIMAGRLDRNHPLWSIDVVDSLAGGRSALVWRIHHCMADGMTAMHWMSELLFDDVDEGPSQPKEAPIASPAGRPARLHSFATVEHAPAVLARELRPGSESAPFAAAIGRNRAVAFARGSLAEMHTAARSHEPGATINDVLLTVVAGGVRHWLESQDLPLHAIRLKVPVSMHAARGADLGNRDSFMFVDVPLADPDARSRLRAVHRQTANRKEHHDAQTLYSVFDTLGRVAPLGHAVTRLSMSPHVFAVNVSNVPGPRDVRTLHAARVDELYSLAEIAPHHALRVAAASLAGSMFVGLNVDPDAVPAVDVLATGIQASMAELADAADSSTAT